jgi:exodeoxyribonuclease VII small subunit
MLEAVRPFVQGVQVSAPFGRYNVAAEVIASVLPPQGATHGVTAMPSFEESLKKLETIVDQLEKGDLALEESLKLFEEGVGLSAACKQELDAAEGKVQMLVKQRDGSLKPEPFLTEKRPLLRGTQLRGPLGLGFLSPLCFVELALLFLPRA